MDRPIGRLPIRQTANRTWLGRSAASSDDGKVGLVVALCSSAIEKAMAGAWLARLVDWAALEEHQFHGAVR